MQKISIICLILSFFAGPALITAAQAQSSSDIIQFHIQAIGGDSAWSAVKCMRWEGYHSNAEQQIHHIRTVAFGKAARLDYIINKPGQSPQHYYQIASGDYGWSYLPGQQNQLIQLQKEEAAILQTQLEERDPFLQHQDQEINLLDIVNLGGIAYYQFVLNKPEGSSIFYYVHPDTWLIDYVDEPDAGGHKTYRYSDYRYLPEGIRVPFRKQSSDTDLILEKINVLTETPKDLFTPGHKNFWLYRY